MKPEIVIYRGILAILLWSPLPFGSNKPWALSILMAAIFALTVAWLVCYWRGGVELPTSFRSARWAALALFMADSAVAIQGSALDLKLLQTISPASYEAYFPLRSWDDFSAYSSLDPSSTAISLLKGLSFACLFCLIILVINTRERARALVWVIVLSGVIQAFWGALMTLSGLEYGFFAEKQAYIGTATGTFVNRNHLAGYLEMATSLGIGLMLVSSEQAESRHWRARLRTFIKVILGPKARLRISLVIMVIALVLTRSRMGNTAFFASLLICGSLALILFKGAKSSTIILLASLLVVDIIIVGTWFGVEKVADRIQNTSLNAEQRDEVDDYALAYFRDFLWLGSGAGSFSAVLPRYKQTETAGFYDHAHNDYLELLDELGIIGFLPLSLAVAASFLAAVTAMRVRRSSFSRGIGLGCAMGLLSLLIHSAVDFNLQIPANAILFLTMMALAWTALGVEADKSNGGPD